MQNLSRLRSSSKSENTLKEEMQKKNQERLLSGKEEGLKIVEDREKGRGLVTTVEFNKGDFVVEYAGEVISYAEAKKREAKYFEDTTFGSYMYFFKFKDKSYCVDATEESGRLGRLVNHDKNGNLVPKIFTINEKPRLVFLAKHFIKCGEEVLYDYGDRSKKSKMDNPWLA